MDEAVHHNHNSNSNLDLRSRRTEHDVDGDGKGDVSQTTTTMDQGLFPPSALVRVRDWPEQTKTIEDLLARTPPFSSVHDYAVSATTHR